MSLAPGLGSGLASGLRARAEALAAPLPPLLAAAQTLARAVQSGAHGRRRAGPGDEFWQYRPAHAGDPARLIDWRRSARADAHFVREREWQAAQSVLFWVDGAAAMAFSGDPARRPEKGARAALLALAAAVLLVRGGERVGLMGAGLAPRGGSAQLARMAMALSASPEGMPDYGAPEAAGLPRQGTTVFVSDFLGDPAPLEAALAQAAARGLRGVLLQVLDPDEEAFPFEGRTIFESMGGGLAHETLRAGDLRGRYIARLAARKARLEALARQSGWLYTCHHTNSPAQAALLWLYQAIEGAQG